MDRRGFVRDAGGVVLLAVGWPMTLASCAEARGTAAAGADPEPLTGIAVFDPSLEAGRRLAHDAARFAQHAFALDEHADIGLLWHTQLAPCVERGASLRVALRPADTFVLARLAATLDCTLIDA